MRYNLYRQMVVRDEDDDIQWITVRGNHIPIKKGQSKGEAVAEFFNKKGENTQKTDIKKSEKSSAQPKKDTKPQSAGGSAETHKVTIGGAGKNKTVQDIIARAKKSKENKSITVDYVVKEAIKTKKFSKEQIMARVKNYKKYYDMHKPQTIETHTTGGHWEDGDYVGFEWKPERVKSVWRNILNTEEIGKDKETRKPIYGKIDWEAKKPAKGEKPKLVFLGGRGGSGKSRFTDGSLGKDGYDKKKYLVIDPDSYKERLPEYKDLVDSGSEFAGLNAWEVHEESSAMKKMQLDNALKKGVNIVLDGTLAKYASNKKTLDKFRDSGYIIDVAFMELPREKSAVRGVNRGIHGRYVPTEVMLGMTDCEENFAKLSEDADHWVIYDNDVPEGESPRFVAKGGKNG